MDSKRLVSDYDASNDKVVPVPDRAVHHEDACIDLHFLDIGSSWK
jgi:hypothetical protein